MIAPGNPPLFYHRYLFGGYFYQVPDWLHPINAYGHLYWNTFESHLQQPLSFNVGSFTGEECRR